MISHLKLFSFFLFAAVTCLEAATVSGTVSDSSSGTLLEGVRVQLRNATQTLATDTTDKSGAFSFATKDTGNLSIRASITGYTTKTISKSIPNDEPLTVSIPLVKVITTTLSGKVTDSTGGAALAGAIVRLGSGMGITGRSDTTDTEGAYSFDNVTAGNQNIQVSLTGYTSKNVAVTVSGAAPVVSNVALVKTILTTVSGKVSDSTSAEALAGAVVRLSSGGSNKLDTTGADGTYSFSDVATGNKTIQVTLSGYANKNASITVSGAEPFTFNIALVKAIVTTVSGKVTDTTSGEAIAGVVVRLGSGMTARSDTTGADGLYSFSNVATGNQSISASVSGYNSKNASVPVTSAEPVTFDIALVKTVVTTVSGKVTDTASGEALTGAIVRLGSGMAARSDTTGADGLYSFSNVATGNQSISASFSGYNSKSASVPVTSAEPVTFNIALVKTIVTTVSGKVADSSSGEALSGVVVRLGNGGSSKYDTTGADGLYTFTNVTIGNQAIRASLTGYITKSDTAKVSGATPITVNFALTKAILTTVTGKVTDTISGAAIAGAVVRIGMSSLIDTTGADGTYSISNVPNGAQTILVTKNGYSMKQVTTTITGTAPVTVNITLKVSVATMDNIIETKVPALSLSKGNLRLQNLSGPGLLKLYSLDGKLVFKCVIEQSNATISLADLTNSQSATYIVNVISNGKVFTHKVNTAK